MYTSVPQFKTGGKIRLVFKASAYRHKEMAVAVQFEKENKSFQPALCFAFLIIGGN